MKRISWKEHVNEEILQMVSEKRSIDEDNKKSIEKMDWSHHAQVSRGDTIIIAEKHNRGKNGWKKDIFGRPRTI